MRADHAMDALSDELRAEIAASQYRSIRRIAAELGIDYTTLFRWVSGQRPIRSITVFQILDLIGTDIPTFFQRVQARAERSVRR